MEINKEEADRINVILSGGIKGMCFLQGLTFHRKNKRLAKELICAETKIERARKAIGAIADKETINELLSDCMIKIHFLQGLTYHMTDNTLTNELRKTALKVKKVYRIINEN